MKSIYDETYVTYTGQKPSFFSLILDVHKQMVNSRATTEQEFCLTFNVDPLFIKENKYAITPLLLESEMWANCANEELFHKIREDVDACKREYHEMLGSYRQRYNDIPAWLAPEAEKGSIENCQSPLMNCLWRMLFLCDYVFDVETVAKYRITLAERIAVSKMFNEYLRKKRNVITLTEESFYLRMRPEAIGGIIRNMTIADAKRISAKFFERVHNVPVMPRVMRVELKMEDMEEHGAIMEDVIVTMNEPEKEEITFAHEEMSDIRLTCRKIENGDIVGCVPAFKEEFSYQRSVMSDFFFNFVGKYKYKNVRVLMLVCKEWYMYGKKQKAKDIPAKNFFSPRNRYNRMLRWLTYNNIYVNCSMLDLVVELLLCGVGGTKSFFQYMFTHTPRNRDATIYCVIFGLVTLIQYDPAKYYLESFSLMKSMYLKIPQKYRYQALHLIKFFDYDINQYNAEYPELFETSFGFRTISNERQYDKTKLSEMFGFVLYEVKNTG